MYQTVLLATDGSQPSEAACEHAVALARRFDARLHAVSVVDTLAVATVDAQSAAVEGAMVNEAEYAIDTAREHAEAAGVVAETTVRYGNPHREILDAIDDANADVVVMGTHGRRGLDHLLLGSVAERVVRAAPVPVLTVRAAEDRGAGE
jgi:nucleotide-binding universal stress UspA family protein